MTGVAAQEPVPRGDDGDDTWSSETAAADVAQRLAVLARGMEAGGSALEAACAEVFAVETLPRGLRPPGMDAEAEGDPVVETFRHGEIVVRRAGTGAFLGGAEPPPSPSAALADLTAPLRAAGELHVKFKVVRIEEHEPGRYGTSVLYRAVAPGMQQDAPWDISWRTGAGGALVIDRSTFDPLSGLSPWGLDEVRAPSPLFVERTRAALAKSGPATSVLARGAGDWKRRIDHVGEPNFFGHNGLAVGDVNGDGREDLYVGTGTGTPNLLYVQRPDGSFVERADEAQAAWLDDTKGVLLVDIDGDADLDLLIAMGPSIVVSANDGEGKFTPLRNLRAASGAAFYSLAAADYDLDGDLDIYGTRYVKTRYGDSVPRPFHDARNGPPNHLLRNDGDEGFTDVTAEVGLDANNDRFSLAAAWSDYDLDGDPDLYVANDFGRNNLYRNDGGVFVDVAAETGTEDQAAGMGVSWGDVDLDGDPDLLVSNMFSSAGRRVSIQERFHADSDSGVREGTARHALGNSLFRNDGAGGFADASEASGLRVGRWAWGARFTDIDLDGRPDVVVPNGFLTGTDPDDL